MKAILEFNILDPEQRQAFHRAINADSLCALIWDIDQYIRAKYKHGNETHIDIEQLREDINDMKTDAVHYVMDNY